MLKHKILQKNDNYFGDDNTVIIYLHQIVCQFISLCTSCIFFITSMQRLSPFQDITKEIFG